MNSGLTALVAGTSTFIGLLALLAHLYFLLQTKAAQRSVMGTLGGEGLNTSRLLEILKQFPDGPDRLRALETLVNHDRRRAKDLLAKFKSDVDVERLARLSNRHAHQVSLLAAVVLLLLGLLGLAYASYSSQPREPSVSATQPSGADKDRSSAPGTTAPIPSIFQELSPTILARFTSEGDLIPTGGDLVLTMRNNTGLILIAVNVALSWPSSSSQGTQVARRVIAMHPDGPKSSGSVGERLKFVGSNELPSGVSAYSWDYTGGVGISPSASLDQPAPRSDDAINSAAHSSGLGAREEDQSVKAPGLGSPTDPVSTRKRESPLGGRVIVTADPDKGMDPAGASAQLVTRYQQFLRDVDTKGHDVGLSVLVANTGVLPAAGRGSYPVTLKFSGLGPAPCESTYAHAVKVFDPQRPLFTAESFDDEEMRGIQRRLNTYLESIGARCQ